MIGKTATYIVLVVLGFMMGLGAVAVAGQQYQEPTASTAATTKGQTRILKRIDARVKRIDRRVRGAESTADDTKNTVSELKITTNSIMHEVGWAGTIAREVGMVKNSLTKHCVKSTASTC